MNPMRVFRSITCLALWFICGFAQAHDNEVAKLEAVTKDILDVLYSDVSKHYTYEQQESAVQSILKQNYDIMVLIRRALGRNWKQLSAEEQVKFKELVTKLIVKAYIEGMQGLERPVIEYGDLVMITDKRFEILSVIVFPDGRVFNLIYRFGRLKSGWQIYDIVVGGVSVISNYRQQFDDHFRKGNGAGLIKKLEDFLEKGELDTSTKL